MTYIPRPPSKTATFLALLGLSLLIHLWPIPLPLLLPHSLIAHLASLALWNWFGLMVSPWALFGHLRALSLLATVALLVWWRWRR